MKLSKLKATLFIPFLLPSCSSTNGPLLLGVDLSDAVCVFMCNNCTGVSDPELKDTSLNTEGIDRSLFQLYKTDVNGVTKRVKCKTKNSDDDSYFKTENFSTLLINVSDKYFYGNFRQDRYFINKKTGDALQFVDEYSLPDESWPNYTSARHTFQEDKYGNIYTCAYSIEKKSYEIIKLIEEENKFKCKTLATLDFDVGRLYYAVDSEGNVAYSSVQRGKKFNFITADGNLLSSLSLENDEYGRRKAFWTGYDGNIYSIKEGKVEKIIYNKDTNTVTSEDIVYFSSLNGRNLDSMNFIFLDGAKKIYYYNVVEKESLELFQLYGAGITGEKIVLSAEELFPAGELELYSKASTLGWLEADENNIYFSNVCVAKEDNENTEIFVVNKLDTNNNMNITRNHYYVYCNDAIRVLNNGKMVIFYWNADSDLNIPGDHGIYMSVGIFDTNTGVLTPQDTFVTGNAARSHIINL